MVALAEKLRRWMPDIGWTAEQAPDAGDLSDGEGNRPPEGGVIDGEALDELTGGDTELAAAILVDFVDSLRSDLCALGAALAGSSAEDVRRYAHRIKGASRTVGARQVATLADRLEAAASAGVDDWEPLRSTADDLDAAAARVAAVLADRAPAAVSPRPSAP